MSLKLLSHGKVKILKFSKTKIFTVKITFYAKKNDVVLYIDNAGYNHWNVQKKYYTGSNSTKLITIYIIILKK